MPFHHALSLSRSLCFSFCQALRTDLVALGDGYACDQTVSDGRELWQIIVDVAFHLLLSLSLPIWLAFVASEKKARGVLVALLQLCQRNSNQPKEKAYHAMWLSVFEMVLAMLNQYKASTNPHLLEGSHCFPDLILFHLDWGCWVSGVMIASIARSRKDSQIFYRPNIEHLLLPTYHTMLSGL